MTQLIGPPQHPHLDGTKAEIDRMINDARDLFGRMKESGDAMEAACQQYLEQFPGITGRYRRALADAFKEGWRAANG